MREYLRSIWFVRVHDQAFGAASCCLGPNGESRLARFLMPS